MATGLFELEDYRTYLEAALSRGPGKGRGSRSQLAEAIRCQTSYVSRVLAGKAQLSLEQADRVNSFLGHSSEESAFFLLLVQLARAGSPSLRQHFEQQIAQARERNLLIRNRVKVATTLDREAQATYYSSWHYAAIHILVSIDRYQTREALAKYLQIPLKRVSEMLDFLVSAGLVSESRPGRFALGTARIHLERDSPMIARHHSNWRLQAVRSLERAAEEDLHYSVAVGISDEDMLKIRSRCVAFIEEIMKIVHESPQSGAHCFALDFFRL